MKAIFPFLGLLYATLVLGCADGTHSSRDVTPAQVLPATSLAEAYAEENLGAFLAAPSSAALHRASCGLFNATLATPPVPVDAILDRTCPNPEVRSRVQLLVDHTLWFTDYCTASPNFTCGNWTFTSNPKLLHENTWEVTSNGTTRTISWEEVVQVVMGTPSVTMGTYAATADVLTRRMAPRPIGPEA